MERGEEPWVWGFLTCEVGEWVGEKGREQRGMGGRKTGEKGEGNLVVGNLQVEMGRSGGWLAGGLNRNRGFESVYALTSTSR